MTYVGHPPGAVVAFQSATRGTASASDPIVSGSRSPRTIYELGEWLPHDAFRHYELAVGLGGYVRSDGRVCTSTLSAVVLGVVCVP
jgi:hypothetical protein